MLKNRTKRKCYHADFTTPCLFSLQFQNNKQNLPSQPMGNNVAQCKVYPPMFGTEHRTHACTEVAQEFELPVKPKGWLIQIEFVIELQD